MIQIDPFSSFPNQETNLAADLIQSKSNIIYKILVKFSRAIKSKTKIPAIK
jgi:hypothetical protein